MEIPIPMQVQMATMVPALELNTLYETICQLFIVILKTHDCTYCEKLGACCECLGICGGCGNYRDLASCVG